jgi:hypothetical protein
MILGVVDNLMIGINTVGRHMLKKKNVNNGREHPFF